MPDRVDPFRAIAIGPLARALEAGGRRVVRMESGQPCTPAPATAHIREALRRLRPWFAAQRPIG